VRKVYPKLLFVSICFHKNIAIRLSILINMVFYKILADDSL